MYAFWQTWCHHPLIWQLSQILLHSLWQIALLGLVYLTGLLVIRSPERRYAAGMITLIAMLVVPPTGWALRRDARETTPVVVEAASKVAFGDSGGSIPLSESDDVVVGRPSESLSLRPAASLVWLAGITGLSLRLACQYVALRRVRRLSAAAPEEIAHILNRTARALGTKAAVAVRITEKVGTPILVGVARPMILLPASLMTGTAPDVIEAMIAHELAHIRRHDPLLNLVQMCVETLLFYHPAVWLLSRHIRVQRELCTDELAARVVGSRTRYARALSTMEELRDGPAHLALAAARGPLVKRIQLLVAPRVEARPRWVPVMCAMLLLCVPVALVAVTACKRQEAGPSVSVAASAPAIPDDLVDAAIEAAKGGKLAPVVDMPTRVYDVREFRVGPQSEELSTQQMTEGIADIIRQSIATESWSNPQVRLVAKDGLIVVTQTQGVHEKIRSLLDQLAESGSIRIKTEFKLVLTRDQQLVDQLTPLEREGRKPAKVKPIYNDDLMDKVKQSGGSYFLSAPTVTLFNGGSSTIELGTLRVRDPVNQKPTMPAVSIGVMAAASADRSVISSKFKIAVNTATPATNRQLDTRMLDSFAATPDGQWCCVGSVELPTQNLLPEYAKEDDRSCTMLVLERASVIQARERKVQVWEKPQITTVKEMQEIERQRPTMDAAAGTGGESARDKSTEEPRKKDPQKTDEAPDTETYVVRVYDIRDLNVLPYDPVAKAQPNADFARAQLVELIRTTSEDWPLELTSINEHEGQLVIKQKVGVHEKISRLLKQIRASQSVQISAEVRILFVRDLEWIQRHGVDKLDKEHPLVVTEEDLKELQQTRDTVFINAPKATVFNGANATIEINSFESRGVKAEKPVISIVYSGASDVHRKNVEAKATIQLRLLNDRGKFVDVLNESVVGRFPADQMVVACNKRLAQDVNFTSKDKVAKDTWVVVLLRNRIIVQKEMTQEEWKQQQEKRNG